MPWSAAPLDRVALAAFPIALFLVLLLSIVLSAPRADPDCAMLLQAAGLVLDGQRPYVDFVELNPPMIVYLNALPAGLARLVGAHPMRVFALMVALLAGWSARSAWASLWRERIEDALAASLVASSIVGLTAWLWAIGAHGQREHLMFLLYMPYLCARCRGDGPARHGGVDYLRGFAAGIGICAKPHYVAMAGAIELGFLVLRRDVRFFARADFAGLVIAGLAYAGHFLLLPADVRDAFFGRWVPLVRRGYAVYDVPLAEIWDVSLVATAVFAVLALLLRLRWRGAIADLAALLGVAMLVSIALVLLQAKGWYYHRFAMFGFRACAAGCIVAGAVAHRQALALRSGRMASAAAPVLACLALASSFWGLGGSVRLAYAEPSNPLRELVRRHSVEGDRVLVCSTAVEPAYPILAEENRLPGSRYLWLFPLAMMAKVRPSSDEAAWLTAEEQRMVEELKQDIAASPPALVVTPSPITGAITITDYLRNRGVFAGLTSYTQVGRAGGYDVYARAPSR